VAFIVTQGKRFVTLHPAPHDRARDDWNNRLLLP
jgi:hypothetical protein